MVTIISTTSMERECKYCKHIYSDKTSLSRHINYHCKFVPDDIKSELTAKQEIRKEKKHEALAQQQISIDQSTNNTTNNTINIQFINICGSEVPLDLIQSIKEINAASIEKLREYIPNLLQPFGSENISHISEDSKKIIRYFNNTPDETFKLLLNDIHKLDENRNFTVPNVKFAIVQYVNEDFDISKANKTEHIEEIQKEMHELYNSFFNNYKSKIKPKYHKKHEIFINNMLRMYSDIIAEFKCQQKVERDAEIKKLTAAAKARNEIFDDRSILGREEKECPIPDYNKITKEIIDTYLTTNSQINLQFMREHKEKVSAIKSAISYKPARKIVRKCDYIYEQQLKEIENEKNSKMLDAISRITSTEIPAPPLESNTVNLLSITPCDDALLTELETARGD
jgi:hypothetical protein